MRRVDRTAHRNCRPAQNTAPRRKRHFRSHNAYVSSHLTHETAASAEVHKLAALRVDLHRQVGWHVWQLRECVQVRVVDIHNQQQMHDPDSGCSEVAASTLQHARRHCRYEAQHQTPCRPNIVLLVWPPLWARDLIMPHLHVWDA